MSKVTNYREVKYDLDTKIEALHWNDFIREVKLTEFGEEGDYYAVYENLDEDNDHDRKKYAVYLHSTGDLICLIADSGLVLDCCYDDAKYMEERNKLYKQIAMLAGWPERIEPKQRYTVRIQRFMDVEVRANDKEQAILLGEKLAELANGSGRSWATLIRNVMANRDYEAVDVFDAQPENEGVWDLSLSATECESILKED